jgi:UV DNA damage endonuclease
MQRRSSRRIQTAQTKSPNLLLEREDPGSESPLTELEDEQPPNPPKKRRRKTKVVEPVVYNIPPVESKMTTFRGMVFQIVYHVVFLPVWPT